MGGGEMGTMEGKTQIRWTLGSSHDTQRRRPHPVATGSGESSEQTETLYATLVATTIETLLQGSNPRLDKTGYARTAA